MPIFPLSETEHPNLGKYNYFYDSDLMPSFKLQLYFWISWTHGLTVYKVKGAMNTLYKYSL